MLVWENISILKELGGCGIKHIFWFGKALTMKNIWRELDGRCIWSEILMGKFPKYQLLLDHEK